MGSTVSSQLTAISNISVISIPFPTAVSFYVGERLRESTKLTATSFTRGVVQPFSSKSVHIEVKFTCCVSRALVEGPVRRQAPRLACLQLVHHPRAEVKAVRRGQRELREGEGNA